MRKKGDTVVNPIYEWTDDDIWNYINEMGIETNPLYQMGFNRVGCIGCPMASYKDKVMEFEMFPTYKRAYIRAFDKMVEELKRRQKVQGAKRNLDWNNGQEVFDWWIQKKRYECDGQMTFNLQEDNNVSSGNSL